jgi:glycosyltransferase involved in cell wall biosynthesis
LSQKPNILFLVESLGQGGAEKVATMLAQSIYESGRFNVFICSVYKPDFIFNNSVEIPIYSLEIKPANGLTGRILNYYRKISRLKTLKRNIGINLTISSLWPTDWINLLSGSDFKIAIIQINILNNIQNEKMIRFKWIVQYVYNKFDKIIVSTASLIPELIEFFKIREFQLTIIPNPIDVKLLEKNIESELPTQIAVLFKKYKILVVANRLHETKNTQCLIPILKGIEDRSRVKLLIIGEGKEEENLKHVILEEGLRYSKVSDANFDESADVYMMGFQKNIHNLISCSKVFLFPTRSEGAPLVLLEALYCGIPVLASDCPSGGVFEFMQGAGLYNRNQKRLTSERTTVGFLMPIPDSQQLISIRLWSKHLQELLNLDQSATRTIFSEGRRIAIGYDKAHIESIWLNTIYSVLGNK